MKSPKSGSCLTAQDALTPSDHQDLSSLQDRLSFDIERQFETLHEELLHELEDIVRKNDNPAKTSTPNALSSLVHTVTDSKIHQMNLELRQYMTAKMDALLQDIKDDQQAFQRHIQQELDQRLASIAVERHRDNGWLGRLTSHSRQDAWISLPALLACGLLLILLISWPQ